MPSPPPPPPPAATARRLAWAGASLAGAALVLFAVVASVVLHTGGQDRWDVAVRHDLPARAGRVAGVLARGAVDLATPAVVVPVVLVAVVVLWRWARRPPLGAAVLAVTVATAALVQLLALALSGVRPAATVLLGVPVFDGSFPSVRTAGAEATWGALALAGLLLVRRGRGRAVCVAAGAVLSAAVAWGQLDRTHAWPTDVLGGWLLGVAAVGTAAALLATWPVLPGPPHAPGHGSDAPAGRSGGPSTTLGP